MQLELSARDNQHQIEVTRDSDEYSVSLDGQPVELAVLSGQLGQWHLNCAGRRIRAHVAARGEERYVFIDGRVFTLRRPDPEQADSDEDTGGGPNIVTQMPGKVVKLLVAEGQEVAAGEGVIILESMKMETETAAPVAGRVVAIHVETGQTVAQGDPLIDIEPTADD